MEKGITDEKLQEIAKSVMFFKNGESTPDSWFILMVSGIILILSIVALIIVGTNIARLKKEKEREEELGHYESASSDYKKGIMKHVLVVVIIGIMAMTFTNIVTNEVKEGKQYNENVDKLKTSLNGITDVVKTNKDNNQFKIKHIAPSDKSDARSAVDLENKKTHEKYRMYWLSTSKDNRDSIYVSSKNDDDRRKVKEGDSFKIKSSEYYLVKHKNEQNELYIPLPKDYK